MIGGKGGRDFRNNYKGHMDKTKRVWKQGREVGLADVEGSVREKLQTTVIEQ